MKDDPPEQNLAAASAHASRGSIAGDLTAGQEWSKYFAKNAFESRFASKTLPGVRASIQLEKEMGEELGAGQNLLGSLQGGLAS